MESVITPKICTESIFYRQTCHKSKRRQRKGTMMDQIKVRGRDENMKIRRRNASQETVTTRLTDVLQGSRPRHSAGNPSENTNLIIRTPELGPETWKMTLIFGNGHNSAQGRSPELSTPRLCRNFFREPESGHQKSKIRPRIAQKMTSDLVTKGSHNCSHSHWAPRRNSLEGTMATPCFSMRMES